MSTLTRPATHAELPPLADRKAAAVAAKAHHDLTAAKPVTDLRPGEWWDAYRTWQDAEKAATPYAEDYALMPWEALSASTQYVDDDGKKWVFAWGYNPAGTCLAPWTGPKGA